MIMMMMANAGPGIEQQASRNFAGSSLDAAALLLPHNKSSAQKSATVNFYFFFENEREINKLYRFLIVFFFNNEKTNFNI